MRGMRPHRYVSCRRQCCGPLACGEAAGGIALDECFALRLVYCRMQHAHLLSIGSATVRWHVEIPRVASFDWVFCLLYKGAAGCSTNICLAMGSVLVR